MQAVDASETKTLFSFDNPGEGQWLSVNDTVMGGRSDSGLVIRNGILHFSGNLSLENNGGFTSIRHDLPIDLSARTGIRLRVKGDGRSYQLRLQTDSRYFGRPVAFSGTFKTVEGEWTEVEVAFDELQASFRGRQLDEYSFDPAKIEVIGILLGDYNPGPFHLEIDRMIAF
ncbi:MAG: CIA30 family protein [Gammaproteobacteria bacterium]|nr:CIA30 family protein [Gammaproteobacteria bacterium]